MFNWLLLFIIITFCIHVIAEEANFKCIRKIATAKILLKNMSKLKIMLKERLFINSEIWNYWLQNNCGYCLKIVENAGIILEYIRVWFLSLLVSEKLVISKCVLIQEYQNQLRDFCYKNNYYLVFIPGFSDYERIKGILLSHKIVPQLYNNETFLLVKIS